MKVWITRVEWGEPDEGLPRFSAEEWLQFELKGPVSEDDDYAHMIYASLAEAYGRYPDYVSWRLYEPGSTVPQWVNDYLASGDLCKDLEEGTRPIFGK